MSELREAWEIPLFPLHGVLFPEGYLNLRIFEPRYLDMVSDCMKQERPFGVVLIAKGNETGAAAHCYECGTLAHITDWDRQVDGLLEISCIGGRRFRILSHEVAADQLIRGLVRLLPVCPRLPLSATHQPLLALLLQLLQRAGQTDYDSTRLDDAAWVSCRLLELLPLSLLQKQRLLQLDDPVQRLERLLGVLNMTQ